MKNPLEFYVQQKTELEKEAAALKRKSLNLSVLRFIVFLVTCGLVYFTFGSYSEVIIVAFSGFFLFSFLVLKYHNLKRKKEVVEAKIHINKTEIKVLDKDFHYLKSGEEFVNPAHFYSNDIDLFGKGSFFQYLNRTATIDGQTVLANTLTENKITAILEKQNALKELSEKVIWRQHFSALASLVVVKSTSKSIVIWISNYASVLPKYLIKIQIGFSLISLALIGFLTFGFISFSYLIIWFFVGLFITSKFGKKHFKLNQRFITIIKKICKTKLKTFKDKKYRRA
jgi:hypothetical protein